MQYLLLIYEDESRFANGFPEGELGDYMAFGEKHKSAIINGNALEPTPSARTLRFRDGKPITIDGPFAETKEQLGGYYLVEADNIEQAGVIAESIPAVRFGSIEIRPIMKFD